MSLIVLILLANKQVLYLGVVDHVLYLALGTGCIKRNGHNPNSVRSKICIEILDAVLRKHRYLLLGLNAKIQQGIAHLLHAQRKLIPGNCLPFQTSKTTESQNGARAILLSLLMDEHREMT